MEDGWGGILARHVDEYPRGREVAGTTARRTRTPLIPGRARSASDFAHPINKTTTSVMIRIPKCDISSPLSPPNDTCKEGCRALLPLHSESPRVYFNA